MKEDAKTHIIDAGAALIHAKGYHNTGIQEILKACGIPKGSFYYYFDSKETFCVEVVRRHHQRFAQATSTLLEDAATPPLERLRRFLKFFRDIFEREGWAKGCPIGNLAQEMGDLSEPLREELAKVVDGMAEGVARVIAEAQDRGDVSTSLDAQAAARFLVAAWHGAIMQMKVAKNGEPLVNIEDHFFRCVLRP